MVEIIMHAHCEIKHCDFWSIPALPSYAVKQAKMYGILKAIMFHADAKETHCYENPNK